MVASINRGTLFHVKVPRREQLEDLRSDSWGGIPGYTYVPRGEIMSGLWSRFSRGSPGGQGLGGKRAGVRGSAHQMKEGDSERNQSPRTSLRGRTGSRRGRQELDPSGEVRSEGREKRAEGGGGKGGGVEGRPSNRGQW